MKGENKGEYAKKEKRKMETYCTITLKSRDVLCELPINKLQKDDIV